MSYSVSDEEIKQIVESRHQDPFQVLGPHLIDYKGKKSLVIRAFSPDAELIYLLPADHPDIKHPMKKIHPDGFFEAILPEEKRAFRYRFHIIDKEGTARTCYDPYSFLPIISEYDRYLFAQGNHYRIFEKLGSHPMEIDAVPGVQFAVWAPNALRVSTVGNFNRWDGRVHQMRNLGGSGIWEIFIPEIGEGELYKYEIKAKNGDVFLKADPYAFYSQVRPETASIVYKLEGKYKWTDHRWMKKRASTRPWGCPVSIYEVHAGSWMRVEEENNRFPTYRELAERLIPYVKDIGFTHIELLPIAAHPYDPSWGYQVSGYYAPTARYGRPEELMEFVDRCHKNDIGVILDWVPAHFPKDAHALGWFDGSCLYEHADPRQGEHPDWGTLIYNYGRNEVRNFLIANALFWLEKYHIDGLRVDGVASMLYLDYGRGPGEWIPNKYGGNENLEAVDFIKQANSVVHEKFPGVMMIAEESTAWPGVSRPVHLGGLGFGFKWNMGWMHDVLEYMSKDPIHRKYHHHNLTFGLVYAFSENFVLPLSHDEVVHGKRSLLDKMPGDAWQKFANLRLLFAFMYAHPGKKLIFMGGEFGQWKEWHYDESLDWQLLNYESHRGVQRLVKDLNRLYRSQPPLYEIDFEPAGFEWIDMNDAENSVITFIRKGKNPDNPENNIVCAFNFTPVPRDNYRFGVPFSGFYREILNTDAAIYGGSNRVLAGDGVTAEDIPWHLYSFSIQVNLPPLGAVLLKPGVHGGPHPNY